MPGDPAEGLVSSSIDWHGKAPISVRVHREYVDQGADHQHVDEGDMCNVPR
jgi:hypothetical protein